MTTLTDEQVIEVIRRFTNGETVQQIEQAMDVPHWDVVEVIVLGRADELMEEAR